MTITESSRPCHKCKKDLPLNKFSPSLIKKCNYICIKCNRKYKKEFYRNSDAYKKAKNHLQFDHIPVHDLLKGTIKTDCIRGYKPDGIRIYQLIFPDKVTYVGQSSQSLQTRLRGHYRGDSSQKVKALMPHLKEVRLHELVQDRVTAWEEEKQLAAGLRKQGWTVLNKKYTPMGFHVIEGANRERFPGKLRCRICFEWKRRDEFYVDKTRSSGRANQCKVCHRNWQKIQYRGGQIGVSFKDHPELFQLYRKLRGCISIDDIDWKKYEKVEDGA